MTLVNLLSLVVSLTTHVTNCAQITCPEGTHMQKFDETSFCVECPVGTFMPWKNHSASKCFKCTKIEDPAVEILISPCDRFHDADIQCKDGYFRRLTRNPREKPTCLKCKPACPQHHFQVHRCENFTDLGCCPRENYVNKYYHGENVPSKCRESPWICRRGQYLDTRVNDCRPCPRNTFMLEDYHSHTKCWDCHYKSEAELPLHAVITQNCTSTQPARYRCKDGFYMNNGMSYRGDVVSCSPCHSCDEGMYEVRQCDGYHDTVCCHEPNMPVVDLIPIGGQCIRKIDEISLYPFVGVLPVREGDCQTDVCYIALPQNKKRPNLAWEGPSNVVTHHQQFRFETLHPSSDVTIYHNILTVCNMSTADAGKYRCKDSNGILKGDIQITFAVACKHGTYSPPHCDKTCSQHCLVSEESDGSPCHHNNGTCLFGCQEGYTGPLCETSLDKEGGNGTEPVATSTIVLFIILVLVILVFTLCVVYNKRCPGRGPKWWRILANHIFDFRGATAGDFEQEHLVPEVVVTPTRRQSHTLDKVKQEVFKIVQTLRQTKELHSETGMQCQQNLYKIFWNNFELREDIGDYLAELGLPEICVKIGTEYFTAKEDVNNDQIWSAMEHTFRVCRSYGVVSLNFAKSIADLGAVKFFTDILRNRENFDSLGKERESLLVKSSLVGLRHLALYAENIHYFQECDAIEVLKPLNYSDDENIKSLVKSILDCIEQKNEEVQLTDLPGPSSQSGETHDTAPKDQQEKIRQLFVSKCIPNNIVDKFHLYNGDVLVQEDIASVTSVTLNNGRLEGARKLWNCLIKYKDWYSCLLLVLRDPQVKQGDVADLMEKILQG